jgi:5'-deoxynucleotidase YfbR-like HD superfamily hydrolase
MLTPTESHGDHCGAVAVLGVLLAPLFGADVAVVYLIGLAHHLHNATLPDAGHAGDVILGDVAGDLTDAGRSRAMKAIPEALHDPIRSALAHTEHVDSPEAQAFHAADALDRVLEIAWHAQTADFSLDTALDDYDLVHEGFAQEWQERVLEASDLP